MPLMNKEGHLLTEAKTKKTKNPILIAGIAVIVLAIAAFVAGRYMFGGDAAGEMGQGGGASPQFFVQAEELPDTDPEATGTYVRREDNSIFIQTGQGGPNANGPVVEIVFTSETLVYRDSTRDSVDTSQRPGEGELVNQTVELASIEDIEDSSFLSVWGERRGDRIFATVVFFGTPIRGISPE